MIPSTKELKFLPGVGPKKADVLQKELDIKSMEDLLYYFPYKYIDRSRIFYIHELAGNMPYVQLKGKISRFCKIGEGRGARYTAQLSDSTGTIELVWFKGIKYIEGKYKSTQEYLVFGKPNFFNGSYNIVHPEIEDCSPDNEKRTVGLQALYNTTEKMKSAYLNSKNVQKIMFSAIQELRAISFSETLPAYLINQYHFLPLKQALINIHFPQSIELLNKAQQRLKFEELFYIQLSILRNQNKEANL
jgi:ATP-dependent DNA helicase RecG